MAPLPPDPYNILGVSKEAQTPEIRSAYRKLVLKCHPDKVQDPQLKEEKQHEFQRVQQAYELLSNDADRQKYDDKVRVEDLRRQMKDKVHISSPKPSAKYSGEFEIRTPDMRPPVFKSSPSSTKTYTFGTRFDEEYVSRGGTRIFETKSNRSAKRDPSFSERQSKRDSEKEREKDKERRRKEEKEAAKLEKRRLEKQRDREIKRDHEEKYRSRNAKPSVEVFEDELPKSERKRSTKKHDDKAGRTSPRDDKPTPSSRPPISNTFYSPTDRSTYESASSYMQATRGPPGLNRSYSYTSRPAYPPAAPSPPPTNANKTYVVEESDSDDYVHRSSASTRRGSGSGPRLTRERSAYRQPSHEVLDDTLHAASSAAARHTAAFSRSAPMGSSPTRHDMQLPRTNSMPQPSFTRPGPGMTRSHTYAAPEMPHGRDRSRNHPQAHIQTSDDEDEFERERRHRSSRRTTSPEPHPPSVFRYEVDSGIRRSHRAQPPPEVDGHGHYMYPQQTVRGPDMRGGACYREPMHVPPSGRYPSTIKTSKYGDVRYSEYPPYGGGVRA